jgi:hypothetical protein
MDLRHSPVCLIAVVAIVLAGCSSSSSDSKQLSTPAQATSFLVTIAHGGKAASWQLAGGASGDAARVWRERGAIEDFAKRVRGAKAAWVCELAEASAQIGFGVFTKGDKNIVTSIAEGKGAKPAEVHPLVGDIEDMSNLDQKTLTVALCG